jgi:hypothetical protein
VHRCIFAVRERHVGGSTARAAYLLRGEIERFEEVDEKTSVDAVCTVADGR